MKVELWSQGGSAVALEPRTEHMLDTMHHLQYMGGKA